MKVDRLFLLVLSIVVIGLWIPRWAGPLDLRWDGAVYYILGTSIAEGKGYRLLHEPGEIEAIQYPPLLPLLSAAPQMALGTSDPVVIGGWLKLLFFLFHAGFILATYVMVKMLVPRWIAFLAALALLLNVQVVFHSNLFFADIPFGLVTVLFVLFNRRSSNPVDEGLAAVCAVTAFLLRTSGVALLAAWVVESLARRQFKRAAVRLLIAAIPVLCWNAYVAQVEGAPSYATPAYPYQRAPYLNYNVSYAANLSLVDAYRAESGEATASQLAKRVWQGILAMEPILGEAVSEVRGFWEYHLTYEGRRFPLLRILSRLVPIPSILLGGLVLGGVVVLIRHGEVFIPVYILASVALICATPWPEQFRRYLIPVAPFLLTSLCVCLLSGSNWLRASGSKLVRQCVFIPAVAVVALIFGPGIISLHSMYKYHLDGIRSETHAGRRVDYRVFYYYDVYKALDDGLDWLQKNAKAGDVVATGMPHWAYLRNGLRAVRPPLEADSERAQTLLDSVPVAYVLLDNTGEGGSKAGNTYTRPLLQSNHRAWKLAYADEKGGVSIYERVRAGGGNNGKQ